MGISTYRVKWGHGNFLAPILMTWMVGGNDFHLPHFLLLSTLTFTIPPFAALHAWGCCCCRRFPPLVVSDSLVRYPLFIRAVCHVVNNIMYGHQNSPFKLGRRYLFSSEASVRNDIQGSKVTFLISENQRPKIKSGEKDRESTDR